MKLLVREVALLFLSFSRELHTSCWFGQYAAITHRHIQNSGEYSLGLNRLRRTTVDT